MKENIKTLKELKYEILDLVLVNSQILAYREEEKEKNIAVTRELFLQMIKVLDFFEMVFDSVEHKAHSYSDETKSIVKRFEIIYKTMKDSICKQGVERIHSLGKIADPKTPQYPGSKERSRPLRWRSVGSF